MTVLVISFFALIFRNAMSLYSVRLLMRITFAASEISRQSSGVVLFAGALADDRFEFTV
jgi:hypothetical protein